MLTITSWNKKCGGWIQEWGQKLLHRCRLLCMFARQQQSNRLPRWLSSLSICSNITDAEEDGTFKSPTADTWQSFQSWCSLLPLKYNKRLHENFAFCALCLTFLYKLPLISMEDSDKQTSPVPLNYCVFTPFLSTVSRFFSAELSRLLLSIQQKFSSLFNLQTTLSVSPTYFIINVFSLFGVAVVECLGFFFFFWKWKKNNVLYLLTSHKQK